MLDVAGYRVQGTIRASSVNMLFRAVRETDGLHVILKTPMSPSPGEREHERYRREFGILQRLQDVKGVARPYACERIHDRPVLLLEWVPGEALSERVGQPWELSRFLHVALSLTATLAAVHSRNVIHKDIKPGNIILEPSGETRLIDFGAATVQKVEHLDAAPSNLIEGTLAYMSPEQTGRMNRVVDYRTDFYSLGVTFYELLTGQRPFQGRDALEWFHAHMAQRPKPPHEVNPAVPVALSAIVMKLLAKTAEERYQSAEGLKADLERCQRGLSAGGLEGFSPGAEDIPSRFQLPQRLYGREAQVSALLLGFERVARTARPELFLISGYSGIGKSSVVHELHKPVVRRRGFFLHGKFDQFQRDIPYATVAQAIRGLVQQLLAEPDEELAQWRHWVNEAWEGQGQALVELVPQLEAVVGQQPPLQELSASEAQHRFHRAVFRFLRVFATPEHPLVVFLDDLQWADLASLQLLQQLVSQPETPPVLWIGAYRDNEVSSTHPLSSVLEEVRKAGARVTDIRLAPLNLEQISEMLAEALPGTQLEQVVSFAALLHEKTGGNPFFLLQLLVTLNQDGLLVREPGAGWRWDAQGVRARGYSDNVVDFMVGKLRNLPPSTQHLLRLAACVGSSFTLQLLGTLAELSGVDQVEQGLEPALQEGMLARLGPEEYRFFHDRFQQAAHALLSEPERKAVHLRIGRLMLDRLSPEELRESLFEVVSQFNAGVALIGSPEERHRVARLNADAGWRAESAVALGTAISYFTTALSLIPGDPWETDYELAFRVSLSRARCELGNGNTSVVRQCAEELFPHARSRADTTAVYCLKSDLGLVTGDIEGAVACTRECLASLGMPISRHPTWEEAMAAHEEVWRLMGERSVESLLELPLMTDAEMKMVMSVLATLFGPAYFSDKHLLIIDVSLMVSITLRHGFAEPSALGLAWLGVLTGSYFKRYREGEALGIVACKLLERHNMPARLSRVTFGLGYASSWVRPLSAVQREICLPGLQQSLQFGDFLNAAFFCTAIIQNRVCMGHPLDDVFQECVTRIDFVRKAGVADALEILSIFQAYAQQLRGRTRSFGTMSWNGFDSEAAAAGMTPERMGTIRGLYWMTRIQSHFMCGAYAEARAAADKATELLWTVQGMFYLREYHLYRALTLAALFFEDSPEERQRSLEFIREHQRQLAEWAECCAENFLAAERMVSAELARLTGQEDVAADLYEEALRAARESGATHHVALANELAADFWRTRHAHIVAEAFAREARAAYLQWGAMGKVQNLEAQWPRIVPVEVVADGDSTSTTQSTQIDALTVVKTQQAISGEMVLEKLVTTLMGAALENAGARRGALLLASGDTLSVAASSLVSADGVAVSVGKGAELELPWTVLAYVRRARMPVVIGDALAPHPYSSDPYWARRGVRSVLCLPLLRQDHLIGALYLENDLATNTFSPARLAVLDHIASQAAISIENARLYAEVQRARAELRRANEELEQRVEERTRELRQAQGKLVDTARAVGMAEVASNVLHNVGNVLTSAVINLEVMHQALDSSKVARLKQTTDLLREHRAELASFLAPGSRGDHLPEYLVALSEGLMQEQQRLLEDMETMGRHIEHIRAIVQVQQMYARTPLMEEECDLAQLVDDALRIQTAALKRHGVDIQVQLSPVPKLMVDKHKVLQILINLITNAKQALDMVPEGSRHLRVRMAAEGEKVIIQVADDGVGITPEVKGKLFEHGFTTRKDGHGFGLHSSALAAQILGGRLLLESEGTGKGAVATLELPI
ncbi:trifunctional serine/threonine-protein kinase/ATP-binding protein/sensor histidine kinase [Hyalangium versicolor]|uniref:trifunctional serine/threonine-protein kinase/ATP-binding protein/sensor histidine kinase n=1 Tax=Hyalangium versicolor TaxID=2861190 RepID=UPI001CCAAFC7|nr:trifunctional serine/threonine-protein kinase/ATP-binding protein/sensor histidine kinase [Hyalangium versicolor]